MASFRCGGYDCRPSLHWSRSRQLPVSRSPPGRLATVILFRSISRGGRVRVKIAVTTRHWRGERCHQPSVFCTRFLSQRSWRAPRVTNGVSKPSTGWAHHSQSETCHSGIEYFLSVRAHNVQVGGANKTPRTTLMVFGNMTGSNEPPREGRHAGSERYNTIESIVALLSILICRVLSHISKKPGSWRQEASIHLNLN